MPSTLASRWVAPDHGRTANSLQDPGTPVSSHSPRSMSAMPEPAMRSVTVRETRISEGPGFGDDPCADGNGDAAYVISSQFDFSGVDAATNREADVAESFSE